MFETNVLGHLQESLKELSAVGIFHPTKSDRVCLTIAYNWARDFGYPL